jgi:hypothetical protein
MPGVLRLQSGRLVRGRGLRRQMPEGPLPDFGLYLLGKPPAGMWWDARWLRWPDFRLPADEGDARDGLCGSRPDGGPKTPPSRAYGGVTRRTRS